MCTYCNTKNYRKIYENHYSNIPKDLDGRKYDVHHIDGNHKNNDPDNLVALSIKDHYKIHESQGDLGACQAIAMRMNLTPEEISKKCSELAAGSNNPMYGKRGPLSPHYGKKRPEHSKALTGRKRPEHSKAMSGINNPMKNPANATKLSGAGNGMFRVDRSGEKNTFFGKKHSEKTLKKLQVPKPKYCCPHCNTIVGGKSNYDRWHDDNCKFKCLID